MKFPWTRLRELGIVGMNQRNAEFIMPYNERRYYPLVDNKIITKQRAIARGIPVPPLYGHIELEHQTAHLHNLLASYREFVIKPANGSGGNGILVIAGKTASGQFRKANDSVISLEDIKHHMSNILSGMYSLGGDTDSAIIEYRVRHDPCFNEVSYKGVPDIRLIVFRGIPLFGMIRLPTRQSDGRANLHQGAVGAGIDFRTGRTHFGVMNSRPVSSHPDTGVPIAGIDIPRWQQMLEMAATCFELAPLGYLGVDLVLDQDQGPMMLELNARPGLAIQIANHQGLEPVLRHAQALGTIPDDPCKRVRIGCMIREKFATSPA
ncbi:MAG: alpha-L-glutamate ligase-like protein [Pseudomonadota bacterium]|nr:alpha-L-glutamate ligase-like protein [Pseudomonadales bacterium]MDY6920726.1 alpha-L-glutamate ligase-like protein [Pseudomonadota bacterium]